MKEFENRLLASDADAAYYWNRKESGDGAWSLVVRRDYLGELPDGLKHGVELGLSFRIGKITPRQNLIPPEIEYIEN